MSEQPNILRLTLKKKWFDMIAAGIKKEEYRETKDYWIKRLLHFAPDSSKPYVYPHMIKWYDLIEFKKGYGAKVPTMLIEFKGIDIGKGKDEWGGNGKDVFRIKLGDIIESTK